MPFKFEDFREEVKQALNDVAIGFLEEVGMEIEAQAKRNSRIDTEFTKGKYRYVVNDEELSVTIGSELENAIWEELGTGEYALNNDGRKTPWFAPMERVTGKKKPTFYGKVVVVHGKNGRKYYKTNGKKPSRALWNAYQDKKPKIIRRAETKFKELS